jgi:hypothetical protein
VSVGNAALKVLYLSIKEATDVAKIVWTHNARLRNSKEKRATTIMIREKLKLPWIEELGKWGSPFPVQLRSEKNGLIGPVLSKFGQPARAGDHCQPREVALMPKPPLERSSLVLYGATHLVQGAGGGAYNSKQFRQQRDNLFLSFCALPPSPSIGYNCN